MQTVDKYIFSIEIFVSNNLSTHAFIYLCFIEIEVPLAYQRCCSQSYFK